MSNLIRRYLLQDLTSEEREQIEKTSLIDDDYFNQIEMVEEELIDEYLRGALSDIEREKFEHIFLATPVGREQVELARALMKYAQRAPENSKDIVKTNPTRRWWQTFFDSFSGPILVSRSAFAAAVLLILITVTGLTFKLLQLRGEVSELVAKQQLSNPEIARLEKQLSEQQSINGELQSELNAVRQQQQQLTQELAQLRNSKQQPQIRSTPAPTTLFALILKPGLVRSGEQTNRLTIPPGTNSISIKLELRDSDYQSYRIAISRIGGETIWQQDNIKVEQSSNNLFLAITIPSIILLPDDYQIKLSGRAKNRYEDSGNYYFRVVAPK